MLVTVVSAGAVLVVGTVSVGAVVTSTGDGFTVGEGVGGCVKPQLSRSESMH